MCDSVCVSIPETTKNYSHEMNLELLIKQVLHIMEGCGLSNRAHHGSLPMETGCCYISQWSHKKSHLRVSASTARCSYNGEWAYAQ